jgi:hypothetical protein
MTKELIQLRARLRQRREHSALSEVADSAIAPGAKASRRIILLERGIDILSC